MNKTYFVGPGWYYLHDNAWFWIPGQDAQTMGSRYIANHP